MGHYLRGRGGGGDIIISGCGLVIMLTLRAGPSFIPRHLTNESCDNRRSASPSTSCS